MAQEERYGTRSRAYSAWHRRMSIRRYIGLEEAEHLSMMDIDHILWVEYDDDSKVPLGLIEEAQDVGQDIKPCTVTAALARLADIPAMAVLWTPSENHNPADTDWPDIRSFRVRRIYPDPEDRWRIITPEEYCQVLVRMRAWQYKRSIA